MSEYQTIECFHCGSLSHPSARCPKAASERAPSEPPAPQGSLRCDGVVSGAPTNEPGWAMWLLVIIAVMAFAVGASLVFDAIGTIIYRGLR